MKQKKTKERKRSSIKQRTTLEVKIPLERIVRTNGSQRDPLGFATYPPHFQHVFQIKTDSRACSFSGSCCLSLISFMSYNISFLFMDRISEVSHFMVSIPNTRHGVCFHRSESHIWMGASLGCIFLPKPPI